MSKYKVYNKSGNIERCTLSKVEYNGSFMDSRVVNATVESNKPINFDIYDYITYRGEKFELDYKPTSSKNASTGSVGNAYVYELTFVSLKYELERCEMRDLVPYDNGIVYPTPITIEFTGTAEKLAERIQACLDELYTGSQKWTITVVSGASDEEKNISISQANCWSAVSLFNTEYGLDFYISGRTITVGSTGTAIDFTFQYGKGKGLYKIERTADTDQGVVTRLRAFGGTRNIGDNYLRDKTEWPNSTLPASMYLPNLMLPGFETTGVDYIDADNISEYGIREGSVIYEDIYPSIVGMTNSKEQRIDKIQSAETITDDTASEFWITTYDLEFEKPLGDYIVTGGVPTVYIKTGQLQGYSFEINISKIEEQSDGGYKLYLSRNTDNGFTVPNKDVNLTAGTEFVLLGITMPKAYIESAEDRLLARAEEYLAKYSKTNYGYEIGLDEIFAARNPDIYNTLYEGKKLRVVDTDLGINEEITIQSLSITEEDGSIPVYKITLNNEVSASTLNRIQGQVSQLESTVTNGFTLLQWQTQQYIRRSMRPYALWTRDGTTMWLYIDEEKLFATVDATLASNRDVIAYADGGEYASGLPVADQYTYGLVKVDGITVRINASGQLEADAGGGIDFTVGTGLDLSVASVLSVKFGTTAGTACQGNDSRLHTHNNKSILDGITSGLISNWNTAYTNNHTHNNKTVLDGISSTKVSNWDEAFSNKHWHNNKSNLDTINQGLGTSYSPTFKAITLSEWTIDSVGGDLNLRHLGQLAAYFSGANNGNFVAKGTMIAEGDVIAYQDGGSYASGLPVADSSTYGLVRYDGTTIGKNSSGQLYVINAGSGGGSNINVIDSLTSQSKTDALSANQGYQLDQRLKNVRWATPDGTDYVRVYLGSEYKDLSKNGHSHSNYMLTSSTSWGTSYANYASLKINGTSKNVSLNGHTHSNYLESSDIYGLTIYVNGSSQGTYNPASSSKSIYITTGGGGDWNGGTVSNGITISTSSAVGISIQTGRPFIKFGSYWEIRSGSDLNFYYNGGSAVAYFSGSNRGNLWIAGTLSQNSDMRLKTVLSPITDVLKAISTFNVFRYKYNNDKLGRVRIGMSAQQVKIYYPELVFTETDGYYSMDYVSMSAVLVGGMQELYTRFLPVENKVKILESRVQNLQLRLDNAYREIFELKRQMGGAA